MSLHPAIVKIIRVLAEIEAERLCAQPREEQSDEEDRSDSDAEEASGHAEPARDGT